MTREEAIAIIRKEYQCVDRDCDIERSCGKCDLMIPTKGPILKAYKMAMDALEQEITLDDFKRFATEHNYALMTTELYSKAITALEQQSVIEDIKAEILNNKHLDYKYGLESYPAGMNCGLELAIEIIDKHIGG